MKPFPRLFAAVLLPIAASSVGAAQAPQQPNQPIYTIAINVVNRTTKAINYQHQNGSTSIDFQGTVLMPDARGEAKVESKKGYMEVEVEFDNLQSATRFGPEFLTYVMWAVTPQGRPTNMGEVILNGTKAKLDVTTELQAFGLVVTAEPYFSVTQPSDVVVMENVLRKDTVGKVEEIAAKYELLQRGQYTLNALPADLKPIPLDKNTPLDLYEARNAVRIAQWAGAEQSAPESFAKATTLLQQAEVYKTRKSGDKAISMTAREAVQTAEDARLIALKSQAEARLAADRAAAADREADANAKAAEASADALAADRAAAAAQAQTERTRLDAEAAAERAAADAKAAAERTRMDAELASLRAARDKADAEAAGQKALTAAAEKADLEKRELRSQLVIQLNRFLDTRDTARGLVVNMSDVLFDSGQYSLKAAAREKLARISGIILAYPSLNLQVEGHTDSVGSDDLNMKLSEQRAGAVRDFLVQSGIVASSISSRGLGESQPAGSNDTSSGRQQNRRVDLVVSGDVIGTASR